MTQPWIHKRNTDLLFILSPPFIITVVMLFFHDKMEAIQNKYSFFTWLFLIVGIDVAHVYASLFKTYFNKKNYQINKRLYLRVPFLGFLGGVFVYLLGGAFFWSALAYVAVYHFVKQQYGFMRLYSRNELKNKSAFFFDNLNIYNATLFPMLYWFLTPNRNFNWFVPNEFFQLNLPVLVNILHVVYFLILVLYLLKTIIHWIKTKQLNIPKHLVIVGTYLSWYLGIVYYNNELIFTAFNVLSHGVPYMALIYFKEIDVLKKQQGVLQFFLKKSVFITFFLIVLLIAFFEEYIWEVTIWEEFFTANPSLYFAETWHFIWIPFLALPQLTHYILDGFIWKQKKHS